METLVDSIIGFERILRYAALYGKRVLYISSSEVYGRLNNAEPIKENEYGYIDILNSRSSYSMGKRAAETLSSSFISEFGVDSVIVRPGHIYGPTASIADNRVSSMFMYAAAKGQNLVLKSSGEQLRSYCYCLDCASAIVSVLFQGISGEAYNISNRASVCTIKEMAEQFAIVGNVELKFDTPSDKEKVAFNPMMNSSLDSNKLEALGWNAVFSKNEGFEHSVLICKEIL
jgi:nucleoside-diphosphate-sugar epimerase